MTDVFSTFQLSKYRYIDDIKRWTYFIVFL